MIHGIPDIRVGWQADGANSVSELNLYNHGDCKLSWGEKCQRIEWANIERKSEIVLIGRYRLTLKMQ